MIAKPTDRKVVAKNRRAWHEYHVLESVEAGLALSGTEVKSLRAGQVSLQESYVRIQGGEAYLVKAHIEDYEHGRTHAHDPVRGRKLLLHRRELRKLDTKVAQEGLTLIPLSLYFNARGFAKIELGLCKGKRLYDKRESLKKKDARRETERDLRERKRGEAPPRGR